MTMIKINPYAEFERLAKRFRDISYNMTEDEKQDATYSVRADITEDSKNMYLHLELPGVNKDDISIAVDNNRRLIVKGEKKRNENYAQRSILRCESNSGKFFRSFILANDLQESSINAKFENGLLSLTIPKREQNEMEKEISIN